jgi:hypothetical protein
MILALNGQSLLMWCWMGVHGELTHGSEVYARYHWLIIWVVGAVIELGDRRLRDLLILDHRFSPNGIVRIELKLLLWRHLI